MSPNQRDKRAKWTGSKDIKVNGPGLVSGTSWTPEGASPGGAQLAGKSGTMFDGPEKGEGKRGAVPDNEDE